MAVNRICILILVFASTTLLAQQNRYMVFFKDKEGTPYQISEPLGFLSQRAVTRRLTQSYSITQQDLPVNPNYLQGVNNTGAAVFFPTRWMNGVLIQCEPSLIPSIESLTYVDRVEFVAPNAKLATNGRKKSHQKTKATSKTLGITNFQLQMLGIDQMHADNFKGEGIIIAVLDAGFSGVDQTTPFQHLFDLGKIDLSVSYDFVYNSTDVFQYDDHGTQVFSVIGALQPDVYTGGAYEANYQLYVTEEVPTEYRVEEYNWLFAAERADSAGVDIIQSSLGYYDFDINAMDYPKSAMDGKTTVVSRAAKWATERGIIVVCSAGNEGGNSWQIITAPADVENVLAVANVNRDLQRSNSSSIGPSSDNRIKPDVSALGTGTSVIQTNGAIGTASGTSLASPLITSLVAGVWQRYRSLTNLEIIDAIRNSASQANSPDNRLGYGIPGYRAVVNFLEQNSQAHDFEVYPNPVYSDSIIIKPKNPEDISACNIELISATGQSVFRKHVQFTWANATYAANLKDVQAGIYFMRITWQDKKFTYKLIKI